MTTHIQIRGWKRSVLIILLLVVSVWGALNWANKQFAWLEYKWADDYRWVGDKCAGYEFQQYRAFSLLDKAIGLIPFPRIGDRDHPIFVRVIVKKTGRVIGETSIYWMSTSPEIFCPNAEHPDQIRIFLGTGANDDHLEAFNVRP